MSDHPYTPDWRNGLRHADAARRCHARCKHSKRPCKGPAMRGKAVCRMHGGKGGAPKGKRNGAYRHGRHTLEAIAQRRELARGCAEVRVLIRAMREWESE
jgi:hypothetical protein